jgi:hypothetical protein
LFFKANPVQLEIFRVSPVKTPLLDLDEVQTRHPMIDTTDLKRELDELTNRLGKTQEYL